MTLYQTYSYDARAVIVFPIKIIFYTILYSCSWLFPGTEIIGYINETDAGVLPITNKKEFEKDRMEWMKKHWTSICCMRGTQFDVIENPGWFKTYRYVPGSLRSGGYEKYSLK